MKKPLLLSTDTADYKFLLKFSDLMRLRDEFQIDMIGGTDSLDADFANVKNVFKVGLESGEKRVLSDEEVIIAFDEIMNTFGYQGTYNKIGEAMAIKQIIEDEDEECSESEDGDKEKK